MPTPKLTLILTAVTLAVLGASGCRLLEAPATATTAKLRPQPKVSLAGAKRAAEYSRTHGGLSLLVYHRGGTILEEYTNGGSRSKHVHVRSITKNFWAIATLMAEQDGFLDIDEPASATLTEWQGDARKRRITLRQLLQQTAGLEPGFRTVYGSGSGDKYASALRLPTRAEPGTSFKYGPGHYEALGEVLKRRLGARGIQPLGYMNGRVLTPLGITSGSFRSDRAGNPSLSAGAEFTARDLLALGRLLEQGAFPQAAKGTAANPAYGMSLWLNSNAARADALEVDYERILENGGNFAAWNRACASTLAPADTIILVGSSGQRVYVIPSLNLIVVRQGAGPQMRDPDFLRLLLS